MGFCGRCGDIVFAPRCKCGGSAVAPVVQWPSSKGQRIDKWSKTYIEKSPPRSPAQLGNASPNLHATTIGSSIEGCPSANRFPRPNATPASRPVSLCTNSDVDTVSSISSSFGRPQEAGGCTPLTDVTSESEILRELDEPELSRVYGSVIQPKETRPTFSCATCATEFQPDATIYPDPSVAEGSGRFLCKPCFAVNGGSKGDCAACHRPVLILKSEGGFVEASGNVWHKGCFCCNGCQKNLGDTPLVDLFGCPSCADCFDSCLKRNSARSKSVVLPGRGDQGLSTHPTEQKSPYSSPLVDKRSTVAKSREGSPGLEEFTQRLNAVLNRTPQDSSPSAAHLSHKSPPDSSIASPLTRRTLERSKLGELSPSPGSCSDSPLKPAHLDTPSHSRDSAAEKVALSSQTTSPATTRQGHLGRPSLDAVEEMKKRLMRQAQSVSSVMSPSTPPKISSPNLTPSRIPRISLAGSSPTLRHVGSTSSLRSPRMSWTPSTPDLVPDALDTMTQSSGPSSPPALSPQSRSTDNIGAVAKELTPTKIPRTVTPKATHSTRRLSIPAATLSSGSLCAKCGGSLFASGGTGRFVTVPEFNSAGPSKTYHTECFRCTICDGPFKELPTGKAVFMRTEGGVCHVECAPPQQTHDQSTLISSPVKSAFTDSPTRGSPPLVPLTNTGLTSVKVPPGTGFRNQAKGSPSTRGSPSISSRFERVPPETPAAPSPSARFGSSTACPGCQKAVSPMEFGVVPGPQGLKWHSSCLVCGGKKSSKSRQDKSQPGCGKRLDSAAKQDARGDVWCRECLLMLPLHIRNPLSETPLVPSPTGRGLGGGPFSKNVGPQYTGTTTIVRQSTGLRTGDLALMRQLTGGGLSPTRQLAGSPTKQLGLATPRPRPKSVIGIRSGKSVDEGRGMFLVKQMTGSFGM